MSIWAKKKPKSKTRFAPLPGGGRCWPLAQTEE